CYLLEQNVVTIIGPSSSTHIKVAHSPIGNLGVPHLAPTATDPTLSFNQAGQPPYPSLIKVTPPDSFQMTALTAFMLKFKWKAIAIVAESTDYGLNGLIELQRIATSRNIVVVSAETFVQTRDPENLDAIDVLEAIKSKGVRIVTLHCVIDYAKVILKQAHQLGMLEEGWAWFVTDGVTFSGGKALFEPNGKVPDYMTGIIGTQPPLQENLLLKKMKQDLEVKVRRTVDISELPAAARIYDAVLAVAYGLHSLISRQNFNIPSFSRGTCSNATVNYWDDGKELFRSILEIKNVRGLQGNLEFNDFGFYSNIAYSLVNLQPTGFTEFGNWTMSNGLEELKFTSAPLFPGGIKSPPGGAVYELTNKTLRVVVLEEPPFVMKNQDYDPKDPQSQQYVGYCMDLLTKLQKIFNFRYTVYEVTQYGRKHPVTKRWNGLVKELVDDVSNVTVYEVTQYGRKHPVTKRWNGLVKELVDDVSNVTVYEVTQYGRKHPVTKRWNGLVKELVDDTIDPGFINFPARVVIGVWWFTNVVLISAYTAKLAAVFTAERLVTGDPGRYAFIFDSPVLDFAAQQEPCNTETIGLFAPQNYGFGLQKDSPYEEKFSLGILKLKEEGFLEMLYERWFKGICSQVTASRTKSENYQLAFNAMIGVFSCLSGGIGISLLVVAGSWLVVCIKKMRKEKNSRLRVYPANRSYPTEILDRKGATWTWITGRQ
ncbi:glutamate receptor ionotropic, NMDA 1-like, partial [Limulus polyphemus]|uniref:Glutamate receptor ionotropic, NMDA 1-like n=1 Tax=Limulus polyphemus TaxID=6850 RepID=A0ABM1TAC9_LIMPO